MSIDGKNWCLTCRLGLRRWHCFSWALILTFDLASRSILELNRCLAALDTLQTPRTEVMNSESSSAPFISLYASPVSLSIFGINRRCRFCSFCRKVRRPCWSRMVLRSCLTLLLEVSERRNEAVISIAFAKSTSSSIWGLNFSYVKFALAVLNLVHLSCQSAVADNNSCLAWPLSNSSLSCVCRIINGLICYIYTGVQLEKGLLSSIVCLPPLIFSSSAPVP